MFRVRDSLVLRAIGTDGDRLRRFSTDPSLGVRARCDRPLVQGAASRSWAHVDGPASGPASIFRHVSLILPDFSAVVAVSPFHDGGARLMAGTACPPSIVTRDPGTVMRAQQCSDTIHRKAVFLHRLSMYTTLGINKLEMNAVKKLQTLGMGAVVATAAFSLFALTANAQQPPAAAPAAPAVVKPMVPVAPPAAKAPVTAPAATTPATAAKVDKAPKKAPSACKGLDETACKAKPECGYVVPTAVNAKTGKADAAYCRKVAGVALKAKPAATPAPASTPAATASKPAVAAPAAPAAVKPNAPAPATKQ